MLNALLKSLVFSDDAISKLNVISAKLISRLLIKFLDKYLIYYFIQ